MLLILPRPTDTAKRTPNIDFLTDARVSVAVVRVPTWTTESS